MKLNKKDYMFVDKDSEELIKFPGQIDGQSFVCRNLTNCTVYICDFNATIYIDNCSNTSFYMGPTETSVFMRNCQDCQLSAAAEQVRISDSNNIQACIFSLTDTALENAQNVLIAPYNFVYNGVVEHFAQLKIDVNNNNAFFVMDFTPQPGNYGVLPAEQFPGNLVKELDGFEGELTNPVPWPVYFGGSVQMDVFAKRDGEDSKVNEDGSMSFKMTVNQDDAQKQMEDNFGFDGSTIKDQTNVGNTDNLTDVYDAFGEAPQQTDLRANNDANMVKRKNSPFKIPDPVDLNNQQEFGIRDERTRILQEELNERERALVQRLNDKYNEEARLKAERKQRATEEREQFMRDYRQEVEALKQEKRQKIEQNKMNYGEDSVS